MNTFLTIMVILNLIMIAIIHYFYHLIIVDREKRNELNQSIISEQNEIIEKQEKLLEIYRGKLYDTKE